MCFFPNSEFVVFSSILDVMRTHRFRCVFLDDSEFHCSVFIVYRVISTLNSFQVSLDTASKQNEDGSSKHVLLDYCLEWTGFSTASYYNPPPSINQCSELPVLPNYAFLTHGRRKIDGLKNVIKKKWSTATTLGNICFGTKSMMRKNKKY